MRKRLTDRTAASNGGLRRQIPDDFKYNAKKLKHLKHVLHNLSISIGTLSSALNEFGKAKGPEISPDGHLGGYGYILPIKDIKQDLYQMIQKLGDIADTVADEMTNPKWDAKDDKEVKELIKEKEVVEEKVEEATPEDDISPDDVTTFEEETAKEPATEAPKTASESDPVKLILASKIKESLIKFFRK
jgi:hypothetical protein